MILSVVGFADARAQTGSNEFKSAHGDFFHLLLQDQPEVSVGYHYQPQTDSDDGPGSFDLNQIFVRSDVPVPLSRDTFLRFGIDYDSRFYDFEEVRGIATSTSEESLHRVEFKVGYGQFFICDDLLLTGVARPGFFSDFEGSLDTDDFRLYGDGLAAYRLNPGAQLVAGVRVDETFDDTPVLPFGGVRLQSEDGTTLISLTVPLELTVGYKIDPKTRVYAGYWISGEDYEVEAGPESKEFEIQVHERRLGLGVAYWFTDQLRLDLEGGAEVGSELDFKTDQAGQFGGDLEPAGYFRVAVGIGL